MEMLRWKEVKLALGSALELPPADRAEFISCLEPSIREDVRKLAEANDEAEGFIDEPALVAHGFVDTKADESVPASIDEYHILNEIGSGGMGTVYLAEHQGDGFIHRVALKIIKRGMDTNAVLKRFLTERSILASLDHPNIARMLDGGSTADGVPYFVMEYVDGDEIRKYSNIHTLGLNQRLELFQKVCAAVSSAHQKLVIHRDIKPNNILVTKEGEPKLLDFGIAKLISPDLQNLDEATVTQFRVLTPEYASPEQIEGHATSTTTDVYSLGVVLYELLTGQRPFSSKNKTPQEIADEVLTSEPQKPSVAVFDSLTGDGTAVSLAEKTDAKAPEKTIAAIEPRQLRGDLDNIVLKAIRREPERRYQSVQEMSEDIRRFLEGLPVKATNDSNWYRFGKFFNRNKTTVIAGGAAALLLVGATAVTGWQYSVARTEKAKADRRFQDVRQLADTILFDHYERIKDLPGATDARHKLVSDALQYLDTLAADSGDDPAILREVATAYKKLADVEAGRHSGGDLGESDAAREHLHKAIGIWERIISLGSASLSDKRDLGKAYQDLGELYDSDPQKRHQMMEKGLVIFRELLDTYPDKTKAKGDYSTALWEWADVVRREQGNAAAIAVYQESVSLREELIRGDPGDQAAISNASLTYKNIGTLYALEKDFQRSLEYYQKAFDMDGRLLAVDPNNARNQMALSFSHKGIGNAYLELGERQKAVDEFQKAVAIQELVSSNDAKNDFAAKSLIRSYRDLADAFDRAGNPHDAENLFERAIAAQSAQGDGRVLDRSSEAVLHASYGKFLLNNGNEAAANKPRAMAELRKAQTIFDDLKKNNTFDPAYQDDYDALVALLKTGSVSPDDRSDAVK